MLEEPMFREASRPVENSTRSWSPKFASAVVGLACLCALSVFLLLYHHDAAASALAPAPVFASQAEGQGKAGSAAQGQEVAAQNTAERRNVAANRSVSIPEPFDFKIKRSLKYQTVGPVGLRLVRVNPRRRVCDVSIQLEGHRRLQRRLQLKRPFRFKPAPSGEAVEITIAGLSRDSVAGSLSTLSAPIATQN